MFTFDHLNDLSHPIFSVNRLDLLSSRWSICTWQQHHRLQNREEKTLVMSSKLTGWALVSRKLSKVRFNMTLSASLQESLLQELLICYVSVSASSMLLSGGSVVFMVVCLCCVSTDTVCSSARREINKTWGHKWCQHPFNISLLVLLV